MNIRETASHPGAGECRKPPSINAPAGRSGCRTISAPTNTTYSLEASTNLTDWLMLTNFPALPVASMQYTDTATPAMLRRFDRTVWVP